MSSSSSSAASAAVPTPPSEVRVSPQADLLLACSFVGNTGQGQHESKAIYWVTMFWKTKTAEILQVLVPSPVSAIGLKHLEAAAKSKDPAMRAECAVVVSKPNADDFPSITYKPSHQSWIDRFYPRARTIPSGKASFDQMFLTGERLALVIKVYTRDQAKKSVIPGPLTSAGRESITTRMTSIRAAAVDLCGKAPGAEASLVKLRSLCCFSVKAEVTEKQLEQIRFAMLRGAVPDAFWATQGLSKEVVFDHYIRPSLAACVGSFLFFTASDTKAMVLFERALLSGYRAFACPRVNCGQPAKKICSRCSSAMYCDASCQHADLAAHSKVCGAAQKTEVDRFWAQLAVSAPAMRIPAVAALGDAASLPAAKATALDSDTAALCREFDNILLRTHAPEKTNVPEYAAMCPPPPEQLYAEKKTPKASAMTDADDVRAVVPKVQTAAPSASASVAAAAAPADPNPYAAAFSFGAFPSKK